MAEGAKSKQLHLNTTDDGAVASSIVLLDATAKLPAVDGSQLTNVGTASGVVAWTMEGFGPLDSPVLPAVQVGTSIVSVAKTITTLQARRLTAGTSGTTTIQLEYNGNAVGGATLSWVAGVDASGALKNVAISQAVSLGDRVSFRITSAEAGAEDVIAAVY